jgi:hypothetical protein
MSDKLAEFASLIKKKAKGQVPIQTEWVTVKEVDWEAKSMTATGNENDLDYYDVDLGLGSVCKKPKVGTTALIGTIHNTAAAYMIDCEEFEELFIKSGESEFTIKQEGFIVKHGNESLKTVLNDLIAEKNKLNKQLQLVVVSAGVSPNVPALQQIEQETESVKQRLNAILIE